MPAIGITGGVSTGKSTFCDCLREILPGTKFFDADAVAPTGRKKRSLCELDRLKRSSFCALREEIPLHRAIDRQRPSFFTSAPSHLPLRM